MNELRFINYMKKSIKYGKDVIRGIGDDTAVLRYSRNKHMLFASDMLVEGVHFRKSDSYYKVGQKCVNVNVSDIASMGGTPSYLLVSVSMPRNTVSKKAKELFRGIKFAADKFGIDIVGGDTNKGDKLVVDISLMGFAKSKQITFRNGAKPGDYIFVSGELGQGGSKHLDFVPRLKESQLLTNKFKINSIMDVSDGLLIDLWRMAKESKVGVKLYKSLIPVSNEAASIDKAMVSGEEFELLCSISLKETKKIIKYIAKHNFPQMTLIGRMVTPKDGMYIIGDEGKKRVLKPEGYRHF